MRNLNGWIKPGTFTGNVVKLVGWTVAAQALYVFVLPVLTRLFTREDFGRLGVLQAASACLIIVSGLRYEVAVLLPESDEDAFNLVGVAAFVTLCAATAVTLLCVLAPASRLFRGDFAFLNQVWWLLPMYQIAATGNELLTNWAIRRRAFDVVARTKIAQVGTQLVVQLGLGFARVGGIGLLLGDVVGRLGGTTSLSRLLWRQDRPLLGKLSWTSMRRVAAQYRDFPLFASGAALMGVASRQAPTLVVAACFGPVATGAYMLAGRVLAAPLELICRAYTQVYLGEGARLSREDPEGLRRLFLKSGRRLLALGAVPAVVLAVAGPWLFAIVFGAEWREAGVMARSLSIMLLANFVSFPLVHTLNILEKQNWQLGWDFATLVLGVGGIVCVWRLGGGVVPAITFYSLAMAAMFAIHFVLSYVAIERHIRAWAPEAAVR